MSKIEICPDDWPYHQWYRIRRRRLPRVAEVVASGLNRRGWVSISPSPKQRPDQEVVYFVHYIEIDRDDYGAAVTTYDSDQYWRVSERFTVEGEADLRQLLMNWLDDLAVLTAPDVSEPAPF